MRTAAAAVVLAVAFLTGCGDDGPDVEACEEAMRQQFEDAASGVEGERPDECDGVSDAELERIAGEILGQQFGD